MCLGRLLSFRQLDAQRFGVVPTLAARPLEESKRTDEQLAVEAAREGSDGPAFVELVRRYRERVWRVCFRLMGNDHDAQDAAQEVFVRLFVQRGNFAGRSKYSTWLHGVALRTCLTLRRGRTRRQMRLPTVRPETLEEQLSEAPSADKSLQLDLDHLLACLSEEDRAMIILKYAENYSYEDLAKLFDMSVSACKMRLSRARQKIQKQHSQ